jgi:hypothetical protein
VVLLQISIFVRPGKMGRGVFPLHLLRAFDAERYASGAGGSRSEAEAQAVHRRLQALVRQRALPREGDAFSVSISFLDRPLG